MKSKQVAAVRCAVLLGRTLQRDKPEIAADYCKDMTGRQIVDKHRIDKVYGVSRGLARTAITYALRGSEGFGGLEAYGGLMQISELDSLASKHRRVGAQGTWKRGVGVHALNTPQLKIAGQNSAKERGFTLWTDKEEAILCGLSRQPKYQRKSMIRAQLIASELNRRVHKGRTVRTTGSVSSRFYHLVTRRR